jgi:hypothetical protein
MTDEQRIAALQEEIRRAGAAARHCRSRGLRFALLASIACWGVGFGMGLLGIIGAAIAGMKSHDQGHFPAAVLFDLGITGAFLGGLGGVALSYLTARRRRERATGRIIHALRALPLEIRAHTLEGLRGDRLPDTLTIVSSLSAEFGSRGELAPAVAPDARGDEASPAEKSP